MAPQLTRVPHDASHLIVSIGGNDALQNLDLLATRVNSTAEAFEALAEPIALFEQRYRRAIKEVLALRRWTAVCTVYNGALERNIVRAARIALAVFNDVILRTAVDLSLPALELRSVCTDAGDYAHAIEPSSGGGFKIAGAITRLIARAGS
jgi:hypothetical protein